MERLLQDGITGDELEQAKKGYLQAQKVARSTDATLAAMLSNLNYLGRTMKYETELEDKIKSLTNEQVIAAWRRYIDPKKLVVVTAGDFETHSATK